MIVLGFTLTVEEEDVFKILSYNNRSSRTYFTFYMYVDKNPSAIGESCEDDEGDPSQPRGL